MVKVDFASHSPQMEPLRADLLQALEGLRAAARIRADLLDCDRPVGGGLGVRCALLGKEHERAGALFRRGSAPVGRRARHLP